MSRINPDYNIYINTWEWIKSHNMDTKNAAILDRDKFMDEIATSQYINIQAEDNKKLVNVVIVSTLNSFSKKKDVDRITDNLTMDGTVRIVIISKNIWPVFESIDFIYNVPHTFLCCDIRKHENQPTKCTVIRDTEEVKWDLFIMKSAGLKTIPRIKLSSDPMVFWLGAKRNEFIKLEYASEDTISVVEYRIVI